MKDDGKKKLITSSAVFCIFPPLLIGQNIVNYIDPGTGSLIIQVLIAGLVGAGFLIKVFWARVKAFFGNLFSRARRNG